MGLDEKGKQIYKRKNYNNIKTSATADQLLQVAEAIGSLQTETLAFVERRDAIAKLKKHSFEDLLIGR